MQPQNDHAKTSNRAGAYQATAIQQQQQQKANADPLGQKALVVHLRVGLSSEPVNALVDTGCQLSTVTWSLIQQLGVVAWATPIAVAMAVVSKDGSAVHRITHKIKLLLSTTRGMLGVHEFLINPDSKMSNSAAVSLVLGWDFVKAFQLRIDWIKRSVSLKFLQPFFEPVPVAARAQAQRRQVIAEAARIGPLRINPAVVKSALKGAASSSVRRVKKQVTFKGLSLSGLLPARKQQHAQGHPRRQANQHNPRAFAPTTHSRLKLAAAVARQRDGRAPSPELAPSPYAVAGPGPRSQSREVINPEFHVVEVIQADGTRKRVLVVREKVNGAEQRRA